MNAEIEEKKKTDVFLTCGSKSHKNWLYEIKMPAKTLYICVAMPVIFHGEPYS